jgi:hypothetical protein
VPAIGHHNGSNRDAFSENCVWKVTSRGQTCESSLFIKGNMKNSCTQRINTLFLVSTQRKRDWGHPWVSWKDQYVTNTTTIISNF